MFRQTLRRSFVAANKCFSTSKVNYGRSPVTLASLGVAAIAAAGIMVFYEHEKEKKLETVLKQTKSIGKPALGGPWVLVDTEGKVKTDEDFLGKFTLIYFGFTYCPDICPSELVKVGKIMNELGMWHSMSRLFSLVVLEKRKCDELQPLFISVDPARDSVGQLKHYGQDFHKKIKYLTGTKDQVAVAARAYRVYFSKVTIVIPH